MAGQAKVIIAGGTESMTMVPMGGLKYAPNPFFATESPEVYTNMGMTAENVAEEFGVDRQAQDEFALRSHQRATAAVDSGIFDPEIVPIDVEIVEPGSNGEGPVTRSFTFRRDEGPRADTSMEALAKLRPVFKNGGTVTAGNSCQMSDGAAAVVVMSADKAKELGVKPWMRYVGYSVAGVPPEIMGIGPVEAVPKVLARYGISLDELELIELNEAFASQSLAVIRKLELDPEKVNVNGSGIGLGHPVGCTGARIVVTLLHALKKRGLKPGMATLCGGGGISTATTWELT